MRDVAVIGAGPGGVAASIYLKRAGFEPLLFERDRIGGLLLNANLVENYPGFPDGIGGCALASLFERQLSRLSVNIVFKEVTGISFGKDAFKLSTQEKECSFEAVIVATGSVPKPIEIELPSAFDEGKIFYEIKDIPEKQREDSFVIIGGGDAAFDYALSLSSASEQVDIVFRSKNPRGLPLLHERVAELENIRIHPNTVPRKVTFDKGKMHLACVSGGREVTFTSDSMLIACGRVPDMGVFSEEMRNRLKVHEDGTTNRPGLFFAGDVNRGRFRQASIAVGDGVLCAMRAEAFLRGADCE